MRPGRGSCYSASADSSFCSEDKVRIRLVASGSLALGGLILMGMGMYFGFLRPSLLPGGRAVHGWIAGADRCIWVIVLALSSFRRARGLHVRYRRTDRLCCGNRFQGRKACSDGDCCRLRVGVDRLDGDRKLLDRLRFQVAALFIYAALGGRTGASLGGEARQWSRSCLGAALTILASYLPPACGCATTIPRTARPF